jgi:hypothetical protein
MGDVLDLGWFVELRKVVGQFAQGVVEKSCSGRVRRGAEALLDDRCLSVG